jgi:hypothetical protein
MKSNDYLTNYIENNNNNLDSTKNSRKNNDNISNKEIKEELKDTILLDNINTNKNNNYPLTKRVRNSEISAIVNFELEKEKMKQSQNRQKHTSNKEIENELKVIEEHFITSQRDKKPILYDEDFENKILKSKKVKAGKEKETKE